VGRARRCALREQRRPRAPAACPPPHTHAATHPVKNYSGPLEHIPLLHAPRAPRYLQSQRDVRPAAIMAALTTLAAPLLFWALITKAGWGLDGAALAFIICQAATLAGLVAFTVARARALGDGPKQTWSGFSGEAFKGWGEYLHYGEPAGGGRRLNAGRGRARVTHGRRALRLV
jgi:hypothetical protein